MSSTVSSLIPGTSNVETNDEISEKQYLTKKRRSFIPVENKLEEHSVYETDPREQAEDAKAETSESELSGENQPLTSGDSEDSEPEKESEESVASEGENTGITHVNVILFLVC